MDEFTAAEAAKWLGISREAVDLAAREGRLPVVGGDGPRRYSLQAVEAYHQLRQAEHIARLARSAETPVSVARKVRARLHAAELGMPRPFAVKLAAMPSDWKALFNRAELAAAGVRDGEGCRWCESLKFAALLGLRPPEYSEAYAELFGSQPCERCGPGLIRPYMAALATRVHPPGTRPSAPAPRPSEAEQAMAREWASQRAVTSAATTAGDDGKAMVARRLKEVRGRLKEARRRGDTQHAFALQAQLQALTADARVVDGRVTAAARPGRLACGHLLAESCSCPRRASKRASS